MIASVITPATTAPLVACRKRQKMPRRKASRASSSPTCDSVSKTESEPRRGAVALKNAMVSTAATMVLTLGAGSALAEGTPAETFAKTCAGCHAAGGNVVAAGATLFPPDLERNGVNDVDTIYKLIYGGKNKMPGYGEGCEPRGQCTFGARLADDDVRGLAEYVLEQSKAGWK